MNDALFNTVPLWLIFAATVGFILLTVEIGFRVGVFHVRRSEDASHASIDPLVGSTLGLLAFVLAFTFGMATTRYDTRRQLVLDDAIAIRTADLRAQQLPEPHRSQIRQLLREYVDVRVSGALVPSDLPRALRRADELQGQLWSRAVDLGTTGAAIPVAAAFTQSIIQMVDLHTRRVAGSLQNSIPLTIWIALYCLTGLAMAITGYRSGIAGRRSMIATVTMVLAFSAVILLIADLDRPQEGFLKVSHQSMLDLQKKLH